MFAPVPAQYSGTKVSKCANDSLQKQLCHINLQLCQNAGTLVLAPQQVSARALE